MDRLTAPSDLDAFGYKQELKRSLGLLDLLVYGLVFIVPIAPVAVFGIVFNASHGMVPLVYLIGLVAMLFTALSYRTMGRAFPVAGSVYAYASRSLGPTIGFLSGWAILLDYLLMPALNYVAAAIGLHAVIAGIPPEVWVVASLVVATVVNYIGIETTARTSFVLLGFQLVLLAVFAILAIHGVIHHVAGAHFTFSPFYNPHELSPSLLFGALSLAALSFLGFDAISTLAEESKGGAHPVGLATILSLCLSAVLFMGQTWLASLFVLGRTAYPAGDATNMAFYAITSELGGTWFQILLVVPGVFLSCLASAITAQAATARLIYGMARDGELPRALAHVDPRRRVPARAILLVAAITLALGLAMVDRLELLTSMVCFGALLGFLLLHVSVIAHFIVRGRSRDWLNHIVVPAIGFLIVATVLWNAEANAKIAGIVWLAAGLALSLILKRLGRPVVLPLE
jgi:amino acid transporter